MPARRILGNGALSRDTIAQQYDTLIRMKSPMLDDSPSQRRVGLNHFVMCALKIRPNHFVVCCKEENCWRYRGASPGPHARCLVGTNSSWQTGPDFRS
jgi:hypothetical protein